MLKTRTILSLAACLLVLTAWPSNAQVRPIRGLAPFNTHPGLKGYVRHVLMNGKLDRPISKVRITFEKLVRPGEAPVKRVTQTNKFGHYTRPLPVGRYYVTAQKKGYMTFSTKPGTVNVPPSNNYTEYEIHLRRRLPLIKITGFTGAVRKRLSNGTLAGKLIDTTITFTNETTGKVAATVLSNKHGRYRAFVKPGRYNIHAENYFCHPYDGFSIHTGEKTWKLHNIIMDQDTSKIPK